MMRLACATTLLIFLATGCGRPGASSEVGSTETGEGSSGSGASDSAVSDAGSAGSGGEGSEGVGEDEGSDGSEGSVGTGGEGSSSVGDSGSSGDGDGDGDETGDGDDGESIPDCEPVVDSSYEFEGTLVPVDCDAAVEFTGRIHWSDSNHFEVWDCSCESPCLEGDAQVFHLGASSLQPNADSGACVTVTATRSDCEDQYVHVVEVDSQINCDLVVHYSKTRSLRENGDAVELQLPDFSWEAIDNATVCTGPDDSHVYIHDVLVGVEGEWGTILEGQSFDFDCPPLPGESETYAHRVTVNGSRQTAPTPWALDPFVELTAHRIMN